MRLERVEARGVGGSITLPTVKHLVVVLPSVPVRAGKVQLADKTLTGLRGFVDRWAGRVTAVGPAVETDVAGNLGLQWYRPEALGLEVLYGDTVELARRLKPDVLLLSLAVRERPLLNLGVPTVVVAENPALERLRYALPGSRLVNRPRMVAGALRQELVQRSMVKRASALVCNGWNAWRWYERLGRRAHAHDPLLVFDSRLPLGRVAHARARLVESSRHVGPLRLGFSGRLHPAKGPHYAVAASRELESRGVRHTLTIFGAGPMEADLRRSAGPSVQFADEIAFDPVWMDRVADEIDLMLLPHIQGDPSGTYLESAGLGVPVVGFENAAMSGFAREAGFAWTARERTGAALADVVERLSENRTEVRRAALAGVEFAEAHAFEKAFDARVDQLVRVAHA
jgi:glycosyltransferase involved in cell wall biosynthesis